jgi:hypothetical protein
MPHSCRSSPPELRGLRLLRRSWTGAAAGPVPKPPPPSPPPRWASPHVAPTHRAVSKHSGGHHACCATSSQPRGPGRARDAGASSGVPGPLRCADRRREAQRPRAWQCVEVVLRPAGHGPAPAAARRGRLSVLLRVVRPRPSWRWYAPWTDVRSHMGSSTHAGRAYGAALPRRAARGPSATLLRCKTLRPPSSSPRADARGRGGVMSQESCNRSAAAVRAMGRGLCSRLGATAARPAAGQSNQKKAGAGRTR